MFGEYKVKEAEFDLRKGAFSEEPTLKIAWNGQYVILDKKELSFLQDLLLEVDDRGHLDYVDCFEHKVSEQDE